MNWAALRREWRDADWLLLLLPVGLTVWGALAIRSVQHNLPWSDWGQHLLTGAVGLGLALMLARFPYERWQRCHWALYGLANLLLVAVLFVGTTALGAQRWIPILGFHVQPSEFAKFSLVLSLAAVLQGQPVRHPLDLMRVVPVLTLPCFLVLLQPNLGTTLVFVAIAVGMLYWAGAKLGWLVLLISPVLSTIAFNLSLPLWGGWVGAAAAIAWYSLPWAKLPCVLGAVVLNLVAGQAGGLFWHALHDYQKLRIVGFLQPNADPLGTGYHLIQSQIAIGSGQLWGRGWLQGTQTQLNFIPEQHTDFIFSAIGEEWGFVGGSLVLLSFVVLAWRLLAIACRCRDNFGSLLAVGVLAWVLFQGAVNIAMTVGLAPITGIPLPWLSHGRSALLTNFLAIGVVQSVALHQRDLKF